MDARHVIERIEALTGIEDRAATERIARAVIGVLLEQLAAGDRTWLARLLPEDWTGASAAASLPHRPADGLPEFVVRVAAREAVEPGFAREHMQSVCRALAEALDDGDRRHLETRLPEQVASLLALPEPAPHLAPVSRAPNRMRRTLSEGRPHSKRPISEAAPQRAQQESLARSDNPHAETKLSTTPGTTQEREADTLARGQSKR